MKETQFTLVFEQLGLTGELSAYHGYAADELPPFLNALNAWLDNQLDTFLELYCDKGYKLHNWIDAFSMISHWYFDDQWSYLDSSHPPKPGVQPYGVSAFGAENLVRDWMKHLGYKDATTTQFRQDEGVDVTTEEFDVQVQNWHSDYVPVSAVREIYGVALSRDKRPIFFSHSEYSFDSIKFAEKVFMPLFRFKPETAELLPCNVFAERILARQKSHLNDIKSLERDWNELLESELAIRQLVATLTSNLRESKNKKFVEAASKYQLSTDFIWPTFWHDETMCQLPERCSEITSQTFQSISALRAESCAILENLLEDIERGFFQA